MIRELLNEHETDDPILDPMGGVGTLAHYLHACDKVITAELEWAWVSQATSSGQPAVQHDARRMPFRDKSVGTAIFSPDYGNRMADHHNARDGSRRNSYTFWLREVGVEPRPEQCGLVHFGPRYKGMHIAIYREVWRVLKEEGLLILNVSDFIRRKRRVYAVDWHLRACTHIGFSLIDDREVETRRLRDGENADARVESEHVLVFRKTSRE